MGRSATERKKMRKPNPGLALSDSCITRLCVRLPDDPSVGHLAIFSQALTAALYVMVSRSTRPCAISSMSSIARSRWQPFSQALTTACAELCQPLATLLASADRCAVRDGVPLHMTLRHLVHEQHRPQPLATLLASADDCLFKVVLDMQAAIGHPSRKR